LADGSAAGRIVNDDLFGDGSLLLGPVVMAVVTVMTMGPVKCEGGRAVAAAAGLAVDLGTELGLMTGRFRPSAIRTLDLVEGRVEATWSLLDIDVDVLVV